MLTEHEIPIAIAEDAVSRLFHLVRLIAKHNASGLAPHLENTAEALQRAIDQVRPKP